MTHGSTQASSDPTFREKEQHREHDDGYNCNIGIDLDINPYISLSKRWIVEGRLFSTQIDEFSFPPLKLQTLWPSKYERHKRVSHPITYKYTRIDEAEIDINNDMLMSNEMIIWDGHLEGSVYPTISPNDTCHLNLARKLSFEATSLAISHEPLLKEGIYLKVEVIAIESCVLLKD